MPTAPHTRTRIVQSRHNARVKQLRAALARPGSGLIGLEGLHLVEEALRSGLEVQTIFVRAGAEALLEPLLRSLSVPHPVPPLASLDHAAGGRVPEVLTLPWDVLQSAVTTDTPQPFAGLAVPPVFTLDQVFAARPPSSAPIEQEAFADAAPLLLVLAGLQDPGNVGAILRSAEAFGASGILALPGTASVWNPKSLRASMGSAFRLPLAMVTADQAFAALAEHNVSSLATVAPGHRGARALGEIDLRSAAALWIGNEGSGLSPELVSRCERAVTIPCPGPVESLNAAIASSILLYEASRQRVAFPAPRTQAQKGHPIRNESLRRDS